MKEIRVNREWDFDIKEDTGFDLDLFLSEENIYNISHSKGYTTFEVEEDNSLLEYNEKELLAFFIKLNKRANENEKEYSERYEEV